MDLGDLVATCGVLALHSHTADEACDETCSVYDRREDS
jgi:hypothetical protein